uniref:Uncharacterized protein n=1 Tax=Rhizophora mucronata TaxID=61149 RepID=A0A2P2ND39_RHIMU
MDLIQFCFGFR